jgi:hypothetical protein
MTFAERKTKQTCALSLYWPPRNLLVPIPLAYLAAPLTSLRIMPPFANSAQLSIFEQQITSKPRHLSMMLPWDRRRRTKNGIYHKDASNVAAKW